MPHPDAARRRAIALYLETHGAGLGLKSTGAGSVRLAGSRRSTSWIHVFDVGRGPGRRRVVAKCSHVYPENNEAWTELGHFRRFPRAAASEGYGCPDALGVIPGLDVLLTRWADGIDLWRWLVRGGGGGARRCEEGRRIGLLCGRWLRTLHDLEPGRRQSLDRATFDASAGPIRRELGLDGDGPGAGVVPDRRRRPLAEAFDAIRREADGIELEVGTQHGDFGGRNILIASRAAAAVVLDMTHNTPAPTVADVASFRLSLRLLTEQYARPPALTLALYEGLAAGYGPVDPRALRFYELASLARYARRHAERMRTLPAPAAAAARWYYRRTYDRAIAGLLADEFRAVGMRPAGAAS